VTLSEGIEKIHELLPHLQANLKKIAPGDVRCDLLFCVFPVIRMRHRAASDILTKRKAMFITPTALLANVFDHRFRGRTLDAESRAIALRHISTLVGHLPQVGPVNVNDVLDFMAERGQFKGSQIECHPFQFWAAIFPDSPLSPLGCFLTSVPSTHKGGCSFSPFSAPPPPRFYTSIVEHLPKSS
jgi:hypothetical protein